MSENYQFVSTDTNTLLASFISAYELLTNRTLSPSDPDRLFIAWAVAAFVQQREKLNYVGNQNIPSRSNGVNLDAIGETIFGLARSGVTAAITTIRFHISAVQTSAQLIPAGTRVSDVGRSVVFATDKDAYIAIGDTYVDVGATCITTKTVGSEAVNIGSAGNGYLPGQLTTLIDVYNYYSACENTTVTDGGADVATDAEYYEMLRASLDAWSVAGPVGAYTYWAKSVSNNIADVKAIQPHETLEKTLFLYTLSTEKFAFVGGDDLDVDSLVVYPYGSATPATAGTDYTVTYEDNLLTIAISSAGALASETQIDVEIADLKGGYVYIYVLMTDGSIASSTIKALVEAACSDDSRRPLTDRVSIEDPEAVGYNIDITYYIPSNSDLSASEIEANVNAAVDEYIAWQYAKLGRDINPAYLQYLLMQSGIKRPVISEPVFTALKDGSDGSVPQVASLQSTTIVNGGYEDE